MSFERFLETVPINLNPSPRYICYMSNDLSRIYPYYTIDLAAAYDKGGEEVALEVVAEAARRLTDSRVLVAEFSDVPFFGWLPEEFSGGIYLDGETTRNGYQRRWEQRQVGNVVYEIIWHCHDGFGREAGNIEMSVWEIDSRLL